MSLKATNSRCLIPSDAVSCVFSDSFFALSCADGTVLTDIESKSTHLFPGTPFPVIDLRRSTLLTASPSSVTLFDTATAKATNDFRVSCVTAATLHPAASAVFVGTRSLEGCEVAVFDVRQETLSSRFQCSEFFAFPVTQISASGDFLAVASQDAVRLFDRRRPGEPLGTAWLGQKTCTGLDLASAPSSAMFGVCGGELHKFKLRGDKLGHERVELPFADAYSVKTVTGLPYTAAALGRRDGRVSVVDLSHREQPVEVETYQAHIPSSTVTHVGCALSLTAFDQVKVSSFSPSSFVRIQAVHLPASRASGLRQGSESPTLAAISTAAETASRSPRRVQEEVLPPTTEALLDGFKRCCALLAAELKAQLLQSGVQAAASAAGSLAAYTVKLSTQELVLTLRHESTAAVVVVEYQIGKQQGVFRDVDVHDLAQGAFQSLLKHVLRVVPIAAAAGIARLPSDRPFPATAGICWSPKGDLYRFQNAQIKNVERLTLSYFQPEVHDEEQCVQVINAAHFEDRIDDHWFSTAAQRVALSGPPQQLAETNFLVCMQSQAKVRNDNARMVAETWTLMKELFTSASRSSDVSTLHAAEPVLPVIEDTELGASVGRALVEDCMRRLYAAEQTQALALVAALVHLNRIRPLRAFGKARRAAESENSSSIPTREPENMVNTASQRESEELVLEDAFDESQSRRAIGASEARAGYLSRKMVRSASLLNFHGSQGGGLRSSLSEMHLNRGRDMSSTSLNNRSEPEISFEYDFPCGYEPDELHTAGVGLVWRGPLTPRDPAVIEPMLYALHAHAEVFQQLGRFSASRLLEKIVALYRPDWPLMLLSEDELSPDLPSTDKSGQASVVSCGICALPLHGLYGLCPECGRAIHVNKHARCVCNSSYS